MSDEQTPWRSPASLKEAVAAQRAYKRAEPKRIRRNEAIRDATGNGWTPAEIAAALEKAGVPMTTTRIRQLKPRGGEQR